MCPFFGRRHFPLYALKVFTPGCIIACQRRIDLVTPGNDTVPVCDESSLIPTNKVCGDRSGIFILGCGRCDLQVGSWSAFGLLPQRLGPFPRPYGQEGVLTLTFALLFAGRIPGLSSFVCFWLCAFPACINIIIFIITRKG